MLENIIYHIGAIVLITVLAIYLFLLNKKYTILKRDLLPFLLKKQFLFPTDRSVFVRGVYALENMLSQKLELKVNIIFDRQRKEFLISEFDCFLNFICSHTSQSCAEYLHLSKTIKSLQRLKTKTGQSLIKNHTVVFQQHCKNLNSVQNLDQTNLFSTNDHSHWHIFIV